MADTGDLTRERLKRIREHLSKADTELEDLREEGVTSPELDRVQENILGALLNLRDHGHGGRWFT